ncbi:MAG: DUF1499 domain-containing protein [Pseudomonadota bacterium]
MALLDHIFKAPAPQQAASVLDLKFSRKPNAALAVPSGALPADTLKMVTMETAPYSAPADDLMGSIRDALSERETLVNRVDFGEQPGGVFTVRTPLMRYPDLCYVSIQPGPNAEQQSLLMYSHSVYGHSDLGANAKRLQDILNALKPALV